METGTLRTAVATLAASAVIAAVVVGGGGEASARLDLARIQDRYPAAGTTSDHLADLAPVFARSVPRSTAKSDRLDKNCADFTWPSIPAACLTLTDKAARPPARIVSVQYDLADRVAIATPGNATVAQR